ncbi:MAG: DUF459 domain-containing protein [Myxococcales bacterium]|nr:DUF459 domain-containing protein [Myxococcales bacterium]
MVSTVSMRPLDRRTFVLGVTAGLAASLLPRRAQAASARILLVGGSQIAGGLGLYLGNRLTALGYTVHRKARSASGLARPDFFDWPAEAARQYAEFRPDATLCMFGGNDGQGLHMGKGADPQWIRWGDEGWDEEYGRRVDAFVDAVTPAGEAMCWLGMPMVRPTKLRGRVQHLNEIYAAKMSEHEGRHFVDTWPLLATPEGEYAEHKTIDGKKVKLRGNDGVHLTVKGAHYVADELAPAVQAALG